MESVLVDLKFVFWFACGVPGKIEVESFIYKVKVPPNYQGVNGAVAQYVRIFGILLPIIKQSLGDDCGWEMCIWWDI